MIGIFDVAYTDEFARVGCVTIDSFETAGSTREWVVELDPVRPYVPGQFWMRELEPLLRGMAAASSELRLCVIDAYVDLGHSRDPGLGRHVHERTNLPVVGVAKSRYPGTPQECEVLRGSSRRPLYVSAAGVSLDDAKRCVVGMAGQGRVPTMIRRADLLSRGATPER